MNIRKVRKDLKKALENGQDLMGDIIASAINTTTGDPTAISGNIGKNASCKMIQKIAEKLDPCQLTEWEKQRVTNCMISAIDKIKERMNNGDKLREDDFFKEKPNGKNDAEEVFESIVITSQRESQEMKQIFYGNMLANIGFINYLDADEFNFLLKVFEKLTYRQCLLLSIFYMNLADYSNKIESKFINYNTISGILNEGDIIIYQEIMDLYQKSLVFNINKEILLSIGQVIPKNTITYGMGKTIVELAGLDKIVCSNYNLTEKHLSDLKKVIEMFVEKSYIEVKLENSNIYIIDHRGKIRN